MRRAAVAVAAVSLAWGLVFSVAAYAVFRAVQAWVAPGPDPAAVSWSVHAGYFWRVALVAYAGGLASFVAWIAARADPEAAARALAPAVAAAAIVLALQALFLP